MSVISMFLPRRKVFPLYVWATFRPSVMADLRHGNIPIGFRGVWESTGYVKAGQYAGQREWSAAAGGPWVPDCDLTYRQAATWLEYCAERDRNALPQAQLFSSPEELAAISRIY